MLGFTIVIFMSFDMIIVMTHGSFRHTDELLVAVNIARRPFRPTYKELESVIIAQVPFT